MLCSTAEYTGSARDATVARLTDNGYPAEWLNQISGTKEAVRKQRTRPKSTYCFRIPFVSDSFNAAVKQILARHNIPARLICHSSRTLKQLATNRTTRQCGALVEKHARSPIYANVTQ